MTEQKKKLVAQLNELGIILMLIRKWRSIHCVKDLEYDLDDLFIFELLQRDPGLLGSQVAKALGKSPSSISDKLERFNTLGFVRMGAAEDERRKPLALTESGERQLQNMRSEQLWFAPAEIIHSLSETGLETLSANLEKLIGSANKIINQQF